MLWRIDCRDADVDEAVDDDPADGRFVLHRHRDADGGHLDLRLEQEGHLAGWRIDAAEMDGASWATEKAPHAVCWLEQDGDAERLDAGEYVWLERSGDCRAVALRGSQGVRVVRAERSTGLSPAAVAAVATELRASGAPLVDAARLVRDGLMARRRVMERLCGLGRELDGGAFDETVWRKALGPLSLEELHQQLRAFEVRFDEKYPPEPASRPETLGEEAADGERGDLALRIVGEGL